MPDDHHAARFYEAEGVEDWRVLGDGACTHFSTDSFAASAKLVSAIGEVAGLDDHPPDVDVRSDGVTVRLITMTDDHYGLSERDVELAGSATGTASSSPTPAQRSSRSSGSASPRRSVTSSIKLERFHDTG